MSTLYITEFNQLGDMKEGTAPIMQNPTGVTVQTPLTYSTTAPSAAFAATTRAIRIVSPTACVYVIGATPVATTSTGTYLPAGTVEFIGVSAGHKIAAIDAP